MVLCIHRRDKLSLTSPLYHVSLLTEQVDQFEDWAGKHAGEWDQSTSICSMWIGINEYVPHC